MSNDSYIIDLQKEVFHYLHDDLYEIHFMNIQQNVQLTHDQHTKLQLYLEHIPYFHKLLIKYTEELYNEEKHLPKINRKPQTIIIINSENHRLYQIYLHDMTNILPVLFIGKKSNYIMENTGDSHTEFPYLFMDKNGNITDGLEFYTENFVKNNIEFIELEKIRKNKTRKNKVEKTKTEKKTEKKTKKNKTSKTNKTSKKETSKINKTSKKETSKTNKTSKKETKILKNEIQKHEPTLKSEIKPSSPLMKPNGLTLIQELKNFQKEGKLRKTENIEKQIPIQQNALNPRVALVNELKIKLKKMKLADDSPEK